MTKLLVSENFGGLNVSAKIRILRPIITNVRYIKTHVTYFLIKFEIIFHVSNFFEYLKTVGMSEITS